MVTASVEVPAALLSHLDLPASAKLTWMWMQVQQGSQSPATPLSGPTIRRGMARLAAAGWEPKDKGDRRPSVRVPVTLLTNPVLGIEAKVLYGLLQLMPGFDHPCGQFTTASLSRLAGATPKTILAAVRELAAAEWLQLERAHRLAPVHFQLSFPGLDRQSALLARVQKRLERANFLGEQLMREYLSLLVPSDDFEDDASPGFLTNPRTDERLQLDRFYPPNVAWEFNGPQHYRATERFTAEDVARQQERDYIKLGICISRGVTLVVVRPEDLTLTCMREKVGGLLPVRELSGYELVADHIEAESRKYRQRIGWW